MKYIISYLSVFILVIFAATACSDISDEITTPQEVNIHQEGVLNSSSNNFHGRLLSDANFDNCRQCHAANLSGGTTGVSCVNCHGYSLDIHKEGIKNPSADNFHGKFIISNYWDISRCARCHGEDYTGGIVSPTCNTCHSSQGGPEACNTCHGDFNNPAKIAPPNDLEGNSETTLPSVGGHANHLYTTTLSTNTTCEQCHIVPSNVSDEGHIEVAIAIDELKKSNAIAEVVFGQLAKFQGAEPVYDSDVNTCQNTYCHGNFEFNKADASEFNQQFYVSDKITGNNKSVIWNKVDGTQAVCGSCHGLPPAGHVDATLAGCGVCHGSVVDGEGNIIDKTKHINGVINVFEEN